MTRMNGYNFHNAAMPCAQAMTISMEGTASAVSFSVLMGVVALIVRLCLRIIAGNGIADESAKQ